MWFEWPHFYVTNMKIDLEKLEISNEDVNDDRHVS